MNNKFFIGIDVGGTKIYGGIVTPAGEIIVTKKTATPPRAKAKVIIGLITILTRDLCREADVSPRNMLGLGVAIPGIVDNDGKVVVTPNLSLTNIELKKLLTKKLKTKVAVGNDVNLGVLGERWLGAGRKARNIVGLFPGTGVGGGVIVKGEFVTGRQGAAAELGHMLVDPNGPPCTCGNTGCLEAIAGRWAIERDIRAAIKKGQRSRITEIIGRGSSPIKSSALAKALASKDPLVTRIMTRAAESLARACVTLNHVFNPDMFLFGGGVIEACGNFVLPKIEQALKKDPFFKRLDTPRVVASKLGDDAVLLGAVALLRQGFNTRALKGASYYPAVKITPQGKISVKGKLFQRPFYIRADGKIKNLEGVLPNDISQNELADICKKRPAVLVIATGTGKKAALKPKAKAFLRKKHIALHVLPLRQAVALFTTREERKSILFVI